MADMLTCGDLQNAWSTQDVDQCMLELAQSEPKLHKPIKQHLSAGGHRYRARLTLSASQALGICYADALYLSSCCELLHNASLVHDDVQDQDIKRRGKPALWTKYGTNLAICAGDLLISSAFVALAKLSHPELVPPLLLTVHQRVKDTIEGQVADLAGTHDLNTYLQIATNKCGGLFSLALELPLLYCNLEPSAKQARQAAIAFARGYQIFDDIEDYSRDSALNLVKILQNSSYPRSARIRAYHMSQAYFRQAQSCAGLLPYASGTLLSSTAAALTAQLRANYESAE